MHFHAYYDDLLDANDDTLVIRDLAARQPIKISPGFSCLYRPRESFVRHTYDRGAVFVDGHGRPGTRFFGVMVAFCPLSAFALELAVRRPRPVLPAAVAAPLAGAGIGLALKRRADTLALATVGALWLLVYAAGMWRGLWLAVRARLRRVR